eukprot:PITA_24139
MPYYLMSFGPEVWNIVLNGYNAPPTLPTDQDERKSYIANAKALNSITSGIIDSEFTKVLNCDSAKEVWDKLVSLYDGDSKIKKENIQTHRREFKSLKMDDEEYIASYFLRVVEVVNSLKGLGEKIEESTVVQKLLRNIPNKFDSKVSAIDEMKELDTLKMDKLHGILTTYVILKEGSELKGKHPLICFNYGRIGHYVAKCPHKHGGDNEEGRIFKKKGFTKKNFLSKQDKSDEDEYVVIKKKSSKDIFHHKQSNDESNEENNYARRKEVLFMAFTEDDEPRQENKEDTNELLITTIEENEELQKKVVSLKTDKEEAKRMEDIICERHEFEIVSLKKGNGTNQKKLEKFSNT